MANPVVHGEQPPSLELGPLHTLPASPPFTSTLGTAEEQRSSPPPPPIAHQREQRLVLWARATRARAHRRGPLSASARAAVVQSGRERARHVDTAVALGALRVRQHVGENRGVGRRMRLTSRERVFVSPRSRTTRDLTNHLRIIRGRADNSIRWFIPVVVAVGFVPRGELQWRRPIHPFFVMTRAHPRAG